MSQRPASPWRGRSGMSEGTAPKEAQSAAMEWALAVGFQFRLQAFPNSPEPLF